MRKEQFADLKAYVTGGTDDEGGGDGPVVILMHGFGAPGFDLVDLGSMLDVPDGTRFVFPEAPLALGPGFGGGRAWWMLDMALFEARQRGEEIDRSDELPEALPDSCAQLMALIYEVERRLGVARKRLVIGGFSQGSMLAADVALQMEEKPAGVVLWSSTLIAKARWQARMPSMKGVPIVQAHGTEDPLLPLKSARALAELWRSAGVDLKWHEFIGGHQIPPSVLQVTSQFIQRVLA